GSCHHPTTSPPHQPAPSRSRLRSSLQRAGRVADDRAARLDVAYHNSSHADKGLLADVQVLAHDRPGTEVTTPADADEAADARPGGESGVLPDGGVVAEDAPGAERTGVADRDGAGDGAPGVDAAATPQAGPPRDAGRRVDERHEPLRRQARRGDDGG